VSQKHGVFLIGEHVEPGEDSLGRQGRFARQDSLGCRSIGRGPADGARIGNDGRLEELGARARGDANPKISDA